MENRALNQHIVSIKIWRADGTVVYSTNKAITNHKFPIDEITEALKGKVVTALEELSQNENEFERNLNVPLYEIYAPLRDLSSRKSSLWANFMKRPILWSSRSIASDSRYGGRGRRDVGNAGAAFLHRATR